MPKAIYTKNEDGDWDFVAAFATPVGGEHTAVSLKWADEVAEYLQHEGETVVVVNADQALLPEILEADSPLLPFNPTPGQRNDNTN